MKVRILGCGTSTGVPRIGNDWGTCDPAEPRNRRTRASILVEHDGATILIDTSPDMREQLLAAGTRRIDAVIWTHDHADHVNGIDDLRQLFHASGAPVQGYARPATRQALETRFRYIFAGGGGYPAVARCNDLPDELRFGDMTATVIDQPHGRITATGLTFAAGDKKIVYATDFNRMTDEMRDAYRGADVWIVDALRREPHPSHATLEDAIGWTHELGIGRAVLVHMDKSMDYAGLRRDLPDDIEPGYDGMEIAPA